MPDKVSGRVCHEMVCTDLTWHRGVRNELRLLLLNLKSVLLTLQFGANETNS